MADRRNSEDRRAARDRRRARKRQQTKSVIELTHSELHLVTIRETPDAAPEKVEATTTPWRAQANSLHSELGQSELSVALKQLAERHGLAGIPTWIVLGGGYSVTKALCGATEAVADELAELRERSQRYLRLGAGEKVMVSHTRALDARHKYALAAIANSKTLDALYAASERAGIVLEVVEPALVAIGRAVGRLDPCPEKPCLVINVDGASVEMGAFLEGRLLLEYRPGTCDSPAELVQTVKKHLHRIERHLANLVGRSNSAIEQIFLTGKQSEIKDIFAKFQQANILPVSVIDPARVQGTWTLPPAEGDFQSEYLPALGGLLGTLTVNGSHEIPDLMDHIHAITREPIKPILLRSLAPLAAVLLIAFGLWLVGYRQNLVTTELQLKIDTLAADLTRSRELQLKKTAAVQKFEQLKRLEAQLRAPEYADQIRRIAQCMPNDVWLQHLELRLDEAAQLRGSSFIEAGVFDFVNWLELAPGVQDVALRSTNSGQSRSSPTVDFSVELNFSDPVEPVAEVASYE